MDIAEALHWLMQQEKASIHFNNFEKTGISNVALPEGKQGFVVVADFEGWRAASFPMWDEDETIDPEEVMAEWVTAVRTMVEYRAEHPEEFERGEGNDE